MVRANGVFAWPTWRIARDTFVVACGIGVVIAGTLQVVMIRRFTAGEWVA